MTQRCCWVDVQEKETSLRNSMCRVRPVVSPIMQGNYQKMKTRRKGTRETEKKVVVVEDKTKYLVAAKEVMTKDMVIIMDAADEVSMMEEEYGEKVNSARIGVHHIRNI